MPLVGFAVASVSGFPPALALGFVIVGAAPGAMASNVIVYLAGGSLAFSIAMTTVATFLSPVFTPSLVQWLGGAFMPVAFWPLMVTIVQTVLVPLLLGITVRRFLSDGALRHAVVVCPGVAAVAIVALAGCVVEESDASEAGPLSATVYVVRHAGVFYFLSYEAPPKVFDEHRTVFERAVVTFEPTPPR